VNGISRRNKKLLKEGDKKWNLPAEGRPVCLCPTADRDRRV